MCRRVVLALNALAEFVQLPNRRNQRLIVDAGLVHRLKFLLNFGYWESTDSSVQAVEARVDKVSQRRRSSETSLEVEASEDADSSVAAVAGSTSGEIQMKFARDILGMKGAAVTVLLGLLECVNHPYIPGR